MRSARSIVFGNVIGGDATSKGLCYSTVRKTGR